LGYQRGEQLHWSRCRNGMLQHRALCEQEVGRTSPRQIDGSSVECLVFFVKLVQDLSRGTVILNTPCPPLTRRAVRPVRPARARARGPECTGAPVHPEHPGCPRSRGPACAGAPQSSLASARGEARVCRGAGAPRAPRVPARPGASVRLCVRAPVRSAPRAPMHIPTRAGAPRALLRPRTPSWVGPSRSVCKCGQALTRAPPHPPAPALARRFARAPRATAHPVRQCVRAPGAPVRPCALCIGAPVHSVGGKGGGEYGSPFHRFRSLPPPPPFAVAFPL